MRASYLFTSESVSEGHPDKVCDRISDEIVDLFFREGPKAGIDPWAIRAACETLATTNRVVIAGETRGPKSVTNDQIESVVREAIRRRHYSYRTEETYVHWVKRFILFSGKRRRTPDRRHDAKRRVVQQGHNA